MYVLAVSSQQKYHRRRQTLDDGIATFYSPAAHLSILHNDVL